MLLLLLLLLLSEVTFDMRTYSFSILRKQESILLTFYAQLFHTKVLRAAFFVLTFYVCTFWRKNIGAKADLKFDIVVNFTNILCAHLRQYSCAKKVQTMNVSTKKLREKLSYEKARIKRW